MYRINEIFHSLQGEGYWMGSPAIFVRFAYCNMECRFCDTEYDTFVEMSLEDILNEISKYNCNHIVLTGGEPSLQIDLDLLNGLKEDSYYVQVETNGIITTQNLAPYNDITGFFDRILIDWLTVSPKQKGFIKGNELKVLFPFINLIEENRLDEFDVIYIQPVYSDNKPKNLKKVIEYIKKNPRWRLSLQAHKHIGIQ
jgi:organic radical activating enzyme